MKRKYRKVAGVILAAGRGSRMKEKNINKVTVVIKNKPLISYPVGLLKSMKIKPVVVVVGHAKDSVRKALAGKKVIFAEQKKRLGTGHAVKSAMFHIPVDVSDIIVLYGDDAYIYTQEILKKVIEVHFREDNALTFLTIRVDDPSGLGRIIRDKKGLVTGIVEEKDANSEQITINEINPNCYIFSADFLREYLPKIAKSSVTGEYYLTSLIKIAKDGEFRYKAVEGGDLPWKGVNSKKDLAEAEKMFLDLK